LGALTRVGSAGPDGTLYASAQDPVVDRTVAVVVEAVARFRAGADFAGAGRSPQTVDAGLHSVGALTHVTAAGAGGTACALAADRIIGQAVAVVVKSVAHLRRGADFPDTGSTPYVSPLSVGHAVLKTEGTLANVTTARSLLAGEALAEHSLVDQAVAVVVVSVADFHGWQDGAVAGAPAQAAWQAGLNPLLTLAGVGTANTGFSRNALAPNTVVRDSVTVVVESVTHFRRRRYVPDACRVPGSTAVAGLDSRHTLAGA